MNGDQKPDEQSIYNSKGISARGVALDIWTDDGKSCTKVAGSPNKKLIANTHFEGKELHKQDTPELKESVQEKNRLRHSI